MSAAGPNGTGGGRAPRPPRFTTRLLERILPPGPAGLSIIGDLGEEWSHRPPGIPRDAWYVREAARLAVRYAAARAAAAALGAPSALLSGAGDDLRHTVRRLARSPGQLAFTVVALGLGVAAPATMYTIAEGLTREIEVPEPERLVTIGQRTSATSINVGPYRWFVPLVGDGATEAIESIGLFDVEVMDFSGDGVVPDRALVGRFTAGVFDVMRLQPVVGRRFTASDENPAADPVALISWALWQSRFSGDPGIVGTTVRLDGTPATVVGVMPEGFRFPSDASVWIPMVPPADLSPRLGEEQVEAVARLSAGASVEGLGARARAITDALRRGGEEIGPERGLAAESWRYYTLGREPRMILAAMVLLVSFVLLIACADVANLLIARALGRARDTSVRVALGASRWRIVRQHVWEAAVLATLAGAIGLGLAAAGTRAFERAMAGTLAYWMEFRLDLSVLAFCAALVLVAALVTGLLPALQSRKVDVMPALQQGGRGASGYRIGRWSRALVIGEVALSCALLVASGVMTKGALNRLGGQGNYEQETVLTARYYLRGYSGPDAERFHRQIVEEVRQRPGVAGAALTSALPGSLFPNLAPFEIDGEPPENDARETHVLHVSPGYFQTLGSSVLAGRDLTWRDGAEEPLAALVNEAFAARWLAGREPLGARVRLEGEEAWATVVGVVPDLGLVRDAAAGAGLYLPMSAMRGRSSAILVRGEPATDPLMLLPDLRAVASGLDPDLPLTETQTLAEQLRRTRVGEAGFAVLFLAFGAAGLVLAAVGLYGLLSFTVGERTRELGLRTALGAAPWRVLSRALGGGALQLAAGVLAGSAIAALAVPLLGQALLGGDPRDPRVYAWVAAVLTTAGLLAALGPARRALRVDVVRSLQGE